MLLTNFFYFIATFFIVTQTQASDIKFYSAHFPPYSFEFENSRGGAIYDVSQEIIKRLKLNTKIKFVPWPWARFEAETKDNIFLIPLARTPEREQNYAWIIHVLDDPYVLVALKKTKFDISTHEAAKKLKIGVLKKSVGDSLLRDMGYTKLDVSSTDSRNVSMLKLERLDAWVAPLSAIDQYREEAGIGKEDLRVGLEFTVLREYIGASKTIDKKTQKKWRNTFEEMKKDGTYKHIMKRYGLAPLP